MLQLLFGGTSLCTNLWIRFARRILLMILQNHPAAQIKVPDSTQRSAFKAAIRSKYPLLENVWGSMDGLKVPIQEANDDLVQGRYYNGWLHGHYLTNLLLLFTPDGRVALAALGAPGSCHDSTLAKLSGIYSKIDRVFAEDGGQIVGDSAFLKYRSPAIMKSAATGRDRGRGGNEGRLGTIEGQATNLRQSSEWGMRALQGSFPRIRDVMKFEDEQSKENMVTLCFLVHLYNYRAAIVGQNQIQSVYMPQMTTFGNVALLW